MLSPMRKRPRNSDLEPRSNSKFNAPLRRRSAQLFGPPLLLEGEDAAAYDLLFTQVFAAIKPVDVIDEMLINDLVALQWEVLRWRRLKLSVIRAKRLHSVETHLRGHLEYEVYEEQFTDDLAEIIQDSFPELQSEAMDLARKCASGEADSVETVNKLLDHIEKDMESILDGALERKVRDLIKEYARGEPRTVTLIIDELLASASESLDNLTARALTESSDNLDEIERIDRLTTIAEGRRNASLREIDRRRAPLGARLRQTVQEIEDAEFKVIEASAAKGKNAH
jgi:hypothetical protein